MRRQRRGQATIETALTLGVFLLLVSGVVDFGRYVYIRSVMERDAQAAARQLAVTVPQDSDCKAWQEAVGQGNGLNITVDPASVSGNTDPRSSVTTTPAVGAGLLYLWPAAATSSAVCTGVARGSNITVVAQVKYAFNPLTPLISSLLNSVTLTSQSVISSEY